MKIKTLTRLVKKLVLMNIKTVQEYQDRQIFFSDQTLNKSFWDGMPKTLFDEHQPVFVLSTGRCGTELLTNILSHDANASCHHAPSPELLNAEKMAYMEGKSKFDCYLVAIRTARLELVMDCMFRGKRYVETNYRCSFFAPHLAQLFPKAKFIHLVRNPWGFIESGVRLGFYTTGLYTDMGRITPHNGKYKKEWEGMDQYLKLAWLWNETNQFIETFKNEIDSARVITINSEELFKVPEVVNNVMQFCGFSTITNSAIKKMTTIPINAKQDRQAYVKHNDWSAERKAKVNQLVKLANKYGYPIPFKD
jgi:hypothetical protein